MWEFKCNRLFSWCIKIITDSELLKIKCQLLLECPSIFENVNVFVFKSDNKSNCGFLFLFSLSSSPQWTSTWLHRTLRSIGGVCSFHQLLNAWKQILCWSSSLDAPAAWRWFPAKTDLQLHSDLHATVTSEMARKGLEELTSHHLHGLFTPSHTGGTFDQARFEFSL